MSWGWRVPFLASAILVVVGLFIRLKLMESPAFERVKETETEAEDADRRRRAQVPAQRASWRWACAWARTACFYLLTVFVYVYGEEELGLDKNTMLTGVVIAAALGLITVPLYGLAVRPRRPQAAVPGGRGRRRRCGRSRSSG